MPNPVTVCCSVSAVSGGWRIDSTATGGLVLPHPQREVLRVGVSPAGFPLPPDAEIQALPAADRALLDEVALRKLFGNCLRGEPTLGQVPAFGRYLTAVLLGPENLAALAAAQPLELQLRLPTNDVEINRLPWEMMHGTGTAPLVGELARDVAITRLVDGPIGGAAPELEPLAMPLRVLFVIGRQLDAQVRPGAEYIGLLRQLKIGTGPTATLSEMHTRLLVEATTEELASSVNEFCPHVVHFICHGDVGKTGGRLLLTRRDGPGKPPETQPCDGATLLGLLRQTDSPHRLPAIVVLNSCHSSDATGDTELYTAHQSLGAQMVAGGVAAAVGMAGEVADGACRLFTHRFYRAVLNQESIALAAANGRRAALIHFKDLPENIEWARPTLFLRPGADRALALAPQDAAQAYLATVPQQFRLTATMPLCDRVSVLQEWESFRAESRAGSTKQVLALGVEEEESVVPETGDKKKFGKSWLLQEIAARSVLDGFVPCLVPRQGTDPSSTLLSFAYAAGEAMDYARLCFGLPMKIFTNAFKQVYKVYGENPPEDFVSELDVNEARVITGKRAEAVGFLAAPADIGVETLRTLLITDYKALLDEITARYGGKRYPLVLIDDFHLFEGATGPILKKLVDDRGLGGFFRTGEKFVIPLVFTHSAVSCESQQTGRQIRDFNKDHGKHCQAVALKRLGDGVEARLACSQYLLYRPQQPLATSSRRDKRDVVEFFYKNFQSAVDGVPSFLTSKGKRELIGMALDLEALVEADDEIIFKCLT